MKRKWDMSNEVAHQRCIDEIIARIDEIDGTAGVIAAQDILDIVTENIAPEIYNMGIADARKLIVAKHQDIEIDLDTLEQKI